jgi:hypothetical protein
MCFIDLKDTVIISLHRSNLIGFYNQDGECLLCGAKLTFIHDSQQIYFEGVALSFHKA